MKRWFKNAKIGDYLIKSKFHFVGVDGTDGLEAPAGVILGVIEGRITDRSMRRILYGFRDRYVFPKRIVNVIII